MDVPEIKDREHLEAWLKTRSREECIAIAHRAAMRVAPLWMGRAKFTASSRKRGLTEIVFFRPLLISGVAMVFLEAAMRQAANASTNYDITELLAKPSNATFLSATDAFSAAFAAAAEHVAAAAFNAADSFFSAIYSRKEAVSLDNWKLIWNDLDAIQTGAPLFAMPLYQEYADPLPWTRARADLVTRGKDWDFWVRWYEAALRGEPMDWKMQEEIALLPSDVWEGDLKGLAAAIAVIELNYAKKSIGSKEKPPSEIVEEFLQNAPVGSDTAVLLVKTAITQHQRELPSTFDAVLGFIALEVVRLQGKNYQTDAERDEAVRQIGVLSILDAAIRAMQSAIPAVEPIETEDAEKVEKLSRFIVRKFKEWPRANADDVVDSICRFALIGAVTYLAPLIGVPALYGFIGGGAVFGGKKIADAVKLATVSKTLVPPAS